MYYKKLLTCRGNWLSNFKLLKWLFKYNSDVYLGDKTEIKWVYPTNKNRVIRKILKYNIHYGENIRGIKKLQG